MACASASRTRGFDSLGDMTLNVIQYAVSAGDLTTSLLSDRSPATATACAGCTVMTSMSPDWYFASAAAPSLMMSNSIDVSVGFGPQ